VNIKQGPFSRSVLNVKGRYGLKNKKTFSKDMKNWLPIILLSVLSLVTGGCVSTTPSGSTQSSAIDYQTISPPAFASDEYIIHQLKRNESPQLLARHYLGSQEESWRIHSANPQADFKPGTYVVVPLKETRLGGLSQEGFQTVPILCYHRFRDSCTSSLCVPSKIFDKQMAYLKNNGFTTISLEMINRFVQFKQMIPPKSIIITIDDGYRSGYDIAVPILKKYGFTATLFIYSDFVGASRNAVTWDMLRQLKSEGFEIGSHTLSHVDLSHQMAGEDEPTYLARIKKELVDSKAILDKQLKQDTRFIAWPFGRYNVNVMELSEQAGYELGFSVDRGGNAFFEDPMALNRDQILSRDMDRFQSRLKTFKKAELR